MADKDINAGMEVDAGNASFDDAGIGELSYYDNDNENQPNAPSFNNTPNGPSSPITSHHEIEVSECYTCVFFMLRLHAMIRIKFAYL